MARKLGEKLRQARQQSNITLEELAQAIGSSKSYVWQLENKTNAKPSADLLIKISNYLGKSPEFLLDDTLAEQNEGQLEDAMFRKFNRLSIEDKRYIERIIAGLDSTPKKES